MSKSCDELVTVAYEIFNHQPKRAFREHGLSDHEVTWGFTASALVTRQNAEEVIAAERARYHALEEIAAGLVERTDKAEADNKRLRERNDATTP